MSEEKVKRPARRPSRKKVCAFCADKVEEIDYKDIAKLKKYITEKGKIIPKRMTGTCSKHQRVLAVAIKRARQMALRRGLKKQKPRKTRLFYCVIFAVRRPFPSAARKRDAYRIFQVCARFSKRT